MKNLTTIILLFFIGTITAQNINENFEKWPVIDEAINITGIDISPNGKYVALVGGKMKRIIIYDYDSKAITKELPMEKDYFGYNVHYSSKGNYLLLQERVAESSAKKAKQGGYTVVDVNSGKVLQDFDKISDAKITEDEKQLVTLENGKVYFRELTTGNVMKEFKPEDATNAIAISPDGKDLAIVKKPSKKEVAMMLAKGTKKKAIKAAAKTKFLITIYDTQSMELKALVPEFYDNINLLYYKMNGEKLLSFNVAQNSYVNVALPKEDYKPTREGYVGRSSTQPDFSYGPKGRYFGIATMETFPSVNIYNVETNAVVDKYDTKMKIWKNAKQGIYAGTNTSFVFLPDGRYVLIAYGNSLIKWRIEK